TCGSWQQTREIAGAIANHWHADFGQRGEYEFAGCAFRKYCASARVDDFRIEMVFPDGEPIARLNTFCCNARTDDFRQAIQVQCHDPEAALEFGLHAFGPRFRAKNADPWRGLCRV